MKALSSASSGPCELDGRTITFSKCHVDSACVITAKKTVQDTELCASMQVLIRPIVLERLLIDLSQRQEDDKHDEITAGESRQVIVKAVYSDGHVEDVSTQCSLSLSLGSCSITGRTITGNGEDDILGSVKASYADPDFQEAEKIVAVKYLKYVGNGIIRIDENLPESVDYNSGSLSNIQFFIKAVRRNGEVEDITSTAIVDVLNGQEVIFQQPGVMTVNKADMLQNKTVTFLIYDAERKASAIHKMEVVGPEMKDIDLKFIQNGRAVKSAYAGTSVSYTLDTTFYENAPSNYVPEYDIECVNPVIASQSVVTVDKTARTIQFSRAISDKSIIFKATSTFRGKTVEKFFSIQVKSVKLNSISVSGDLSTTKGSVCEYAITAEYDDERTADVSSSAEIRLISGKPSNVVISGNSVTFSTVNGAEEAFTFNAKYTEDGTAVERMFTVIVRNTGN